MGLEKISLPSGPGSIEGLGDAFEPQLNTGTSSYSAKVAIPPGVAGLQPEVTLRYNSGSGNGHFGIAWKGPQMCISRQVEKGLPVYGDTDTFTFGGEELVPLSDGTYRVENEGAFQRIRQANGGWEVTAKNGTIYKLGQVANRVSKITRPGSTSFDDTFKWCVDEVVDVHGNRMEYRYVTFGDSPGDIFCTEIRYSIFGDNYHAVHFDYDVRPDAFSSFLSGFEIRCARRCSQIRVESKRQLVRKYGLSYAAEPGDPVESIAPADAGLNFSLLRKFTQFDNGSSTNGSYLPPLRFGYTRMDVANATIGVVTDNPPYSLENPNLTFTDLNTDSLPDLLFTDPLTGQHSVYYNEGNGAFGPAVNLTNSPTGVTLDNGNVTLADLNGDARIDLVQKFGGANELFVYYPNQVAPLDNDDTKPFWGAAVEFHQPFPNFDLSEPSVRSLDLDNDKHIDFMRTTQFGFVYYLNRTNHWEERGLLLFGESGMGDLTMADNVQFSKPAGGGAEVPNEQVKLADLNGDRLLDLVSIHTFGTLLEVTYWPNRGLGNWGNRTTMSGSVDLGVVQLEDAFVRDVNGDGLADVVAVAFNHIAFWINQGNNTFSREFRWDNSPEYIRGQTVLTQADINGNGSTDFLWENFDPGSGSFRIEYLDFNGLVKPNLMRVIDNGIGLQTLISYRTSTDFYVASKQGGNPWRTRLPFPSWCVANITKQFGLDLDSVPGPDSYITDFAYHNGYYDPLEKEFRGFSFAKKVERGDDRYLGTTNAVTVHSPSTITRFAFHTGVPDGIDNNGDGRIDELIGRSGYEEEPLKGRVLWTETTLLTGDFDGRDNDGDGQVDERDEGQADGYWADDDVVYTRETNSWQVKLIHTPTNGFAYRDADGAIQSAFSISARTTVPKQIRFAFVGANAVDLIEANGTLSVPNNLQPPRPVAPVRAKKVIYNETEVDFFGNPLVQRNYGEHSPGSTDDDERFSLSGYAMNLASWIHSLPAEARVTDEHGVFVSCSQSFYDGADFAGLPMSQVGNRGLLMREVQFVNGDTLPPSLNDTPASVSSDAGDPRLPANASLLALRNKFDAFGNLTVARDPLWNGAGSGHERRYEYDSQFHTYVERETIVVGLSSADLVATAAYDKGAAVITSFTDFNDNEISFQYDSFYRLVGIVKPYDSSTHPTQVFEYRPGDIFRHVYYNYDAAGNLSLQPTANAEVVSAVRTKAREQSNTGNTFDVAAYTDGAGHKLGIAEEGENTGQFVYKDVKRYTSLGHERFAYLPFFASQGEFQSPPVNVAHMDMFYDEIGRSFRLVNPHETTNFLVRSFAETIYLPLESEQFDEEDTNPASKHFGTPHVQHRDGLGRLTGVDEVVKLSDVGEDQANSVSWPTRYRYDLQDKLTHITDSQSNQKWFRYDGLGRKIFMNDLNRGVMFWTYDDASNLISTKDAKNQVINYAYDGVNRLLTEDYADDASPEFTYGRTPDVTYHYDIPYGALNPGDNTTLTAVNTKGYLSWVEDPSGQEHNSYDARSRVSWAVKRIRDPQHGQLANFRTGFSYDSLDRLTRLQYADNDEIQYVYNPRNLTKRIFGAVAGDVVTNISYIETDQLSSIDYGNGVRTSYAYDPRQRLIDLHTHRKNDNFDLIHYGYRFDRVSNILRIDDERSGSAVPAGDERRNTQVFNYDNLYRLTRVQYGFHLPGEADRNDGSIEYRYDRIGNMLNKISDIVHVERGYSVTDLGDMAYGETGGRSNRLGRKASEPPGPHALTDITPRTPPLATRSYTYDRNGNTTFLDGMTNTWDFKDRLVAVETAEMRAEYQYDYADRRIWKRVDWKTETHADTGTAHQDYVLYPDRYFEVREQEAPVKYVWNGHTRVARVTGNLENETHRIQRFKIFTGWNLVGLAITATNGIQQLINSSSITITEIRKWNRTRLEWDTVNSLETLIAGSVLWLRSTSNGTLSVIGEYTPRTENRTIPLGSTFIAGWGLEPVAASAFSTNVSTVAKYDSISREWNYFTSPGFADPTNTPRHFSPQSVVLSRAAVLSQLQEIRENRRIFFYHVDHLSSAVIIADQGGSVSCHEVYYPYGGSRYNSKTQPELESVYKYTDKETDKETGSGYFGARYQHFGSGRFSSVDRYASALITDADPNAVLVTPQNLACYSYAGNNPVVYRDPSGNWRLWYQAEAGFSLSIGKWKRDFFEFSGEGCMHDSSGPCKSDSYSLGHSSTLIDIDGSGIGSSIQYNFKVVSVEGGFKKSTSGPGFAFYGKFEVNGVIVELAMNVSDDAYKKFQNSDNFKDLLKGSEFTVGFGYGNNTDKYTGKSVKLGGEVIVKISGSGKEFLDVLNSVTKSLENGVSGVSKLIEGLKNDLPSLPDADGSALQLLEYDGPIPSL